MTEKKEQRTDEELIAEFKAGNTAAFDEIVERFGPRLYQTAYALLSSHHDAEEVVQDTFVRAFRALPKFRGDSSLSTWLQRIATKLSRNKYHWNRRRGAEVNMSLTRDAEEHGEEPDGEEISLPDERHVPDRELSTAELEKTVKAGFDALPESVRETMVLRHVRECSYEEIAAILNCKVGTVKSRIARGRELLMNFLKRNEVV